MAGDGAVGHVGEWLARDVLGRRRASGRPPALADANEGDASRTSHDPAVAASGELRNVGWRSRVLGGMYVIVGFLILNGVLYGAQEILAADDKEAVAGFAVLMDDMEQQIDAIEAAVERGRATRRMEAVYPELVQDFNGLVPAYNRLAEKAYSRWWLLPVPLPRVASRAARP